MRWLLAAAPLLALLVTGTPSSAGQSITNWPSYLFDSGHSSYNAQATAVTPASASGLVLAWNFRVPDPTMPGQPGGHFFASPTVYDGAVYIGADTGVFYKLSETTGAVEAEQFLGFAPAETCDRIGIVATATVAVDPVLGRTVVYIGGGDGNLYALDGSDLSVIWSSPANVQTPGVNDYYNWASPLVVGGRVYQGISSQCDHPLVRGGLKAFDQHTGTLVAVYHSVPSGAVGASIWSTAAASPDGKLIFVTTGNADPQGSDRGDSYSIVALDAATLAKRDIWTISTIVKPVDLDFGGSPTVFSGLVKGKLTPLIGAVNKNGQYYVWRMNNLRRGPVWKRRLGTGHDLAASAWDGNHLFAASTNTTIDQVPYNGSIRELDPSTGKPLWETGLPGLVFGSPTVDGAGVVGVATYDLSGAPNAAYLIDVSDGAILATVSTKNSPAFSQVVFADGFVLVAVVKHHLYALRPGP